MEEITSPLNKPSKKAKTCPRIAWYIARAIQENETDIAKEIRKLILEMHTRKEIVRRTRENIERVIREKDYIPLGTKITDKILSICIGFFLGDEEAKKIRKNMRRGEGHENPLTEAELEDILKKRSLLLLEKSGKIPRSDEERWDLEELFATNREKKTIQEFQKIADNINDTYNNKRTAKAIKAYYHRWRIS